MARFIVKLTLGLTLISVALLLLGMALGRAADTLPAIALELRETPECRLPCWRGITPGVHTLAEAKVILTDAGYTVISTITGGASLYQFGTQAYRRCEVAITTDTSGVVTSLQLDHCPPTRLGDVLRSLGQPEGVLADRFGLAFAESSIVVYAQRISCVRRYTLATFVESIKLRPANEVLSSVYPWRGLVDLRAYMPRQRVTLNC
ncbi:MAG: hypothetical protein H7Y11_05600 [Armatimonadetes bacterium]|nr:hypothetical protein [Anaerolineae bacterium]